MLQQEQDFIASSASGFESDTVTRAPRWLQKERRATQIWRPTTSTRLSLRSIRLISTAKAIGLKGFQ
jgi:hypothetical protein